MAVRPPPVTFAERVSAATAPDRDRFIDAVRAGSLLIVALGHWLMATVVVRDGHITGANALTSIPAVSLTARSPRTPTENPPSVDEEAQKVGPGKDPNRFAVVDDQERILGLQDVASG